MSHTHTRTHTFSLSLTLSLSHTHILSLKFSPARNFPRGRLLLLPPLGPPCPSFSSISSCISICASPPASVLHYHRSAVRIHIWGILVLCLTDRLGGEWWWQDMRSIAIGNHFWGFLVLFLTARFLAEFCWVGLDLFGSGGGMRLVVYDLSFSFFLFGVVFVGLAGVWWWRLLRVALPLWLQLSSYLELGLGHSGLGLACV